MGFLRMLAAPDERSLKLARIVCRLVNDGAMLGELEERVTVIDDQERRFKVMPRVWIERLLLAAERGALERMSEDRIVERLLAPQEVSA